MSFESYLICSVEMLLFWPTVNFVMKNTVTVIIEGAYFFRNGKVKYSIFKISQ